MKKTFANPAEAEQVINRDIATAVSTSVLALVTGSLALMQYFENEPSKDLLVSPEVATKGLGFVALSSLVAFGYSSWHALHTSHQQNQEIRTTEGLE